jgi:hypothetical protein
MTTPIAAVRIPMKTLQPARWEALWERVSVGISNLLM